MNAELQQRIETLYGGPIPETPEIDKAGLIADSNKPAASSWPEASPEAIAQDPGLAMEEVDVYDNASVPEKIRMLGIVDEEDLIKVEPYLPPASPEKSLIDRIAELPVSKLPLIRDMIAVAQSDSLPEAAVNAIPLYPPMAKARTIQDAVKGIGGLFKAEGGEISQEELMMQAMAAEGAAPEDPNAAIASSIEELMMQAQATEDPTERALFEQNAKTIEVNASAPMAEMAQQLASQGRGEDIALAHVRPGEVILPPEAFEDAEFEAVVERKFKELEIDPEQMVVGVGIASLNPITGLEEFGFFKKLAKGLKKVVKKVIKPIAKVAQFIPGPWMIPAQIISKVSTVYDVAKGRANPLQLLTLGTPLGPAGGVTNAAGKTVTGGGIAGLKEFFTKGADDVGFFGNIKKGIGGLFTGGGKDKVGKFGSIGDFFGGIGDATGITNYAGQAESAEDALARIMPGLSPTEQEYINVEMQTGLSAEQILQRLQSVGLYEGAQEGGSWFGTKTPAGIKGIEDFFKGEGGGGGIGGLSGGQGAALAALLAKLAYDEAKNRKGVNLTPALTMDRYGGYNLAAAHAEAAGEEAPDPRAYGMLARGTIPTLSGGRRPTEAQAALEEQKASGMYQGGPIRRYADGGNVATVDFERMDGRISGPGSEKSDDIPAMLSDGEFVMNGQSVRGAGAFDLENDGGIITLVKNGGESREKGTELMYKMMNLFSEFAGKPKARMSA